MNWTVTPNECFLTTDDIVPPDGTMHNGHKVLRVSFMKARDGDSWCIVTGLTNQPRMSLEGTPGLCNSAEYVLRKTSGFRLEFASVTDALAAFNL